jgi:hypothetical protein
VDLGGRIGVLSTGTPPVCIVESNDSYRLFRSQPSGGFTAAGGEWGLELDRVVLSSDGTTVAALEPDLGVQVSVDGGARFRRVPGTARATAITTGRLGSRPSAFTALYDPTSGRSTIVWIDAASATGYVVSDLAPPDDESDDDYTRVTALAWNAGTETLWATGKFGLARWRRPPSA